MSRYLDYETYTGIMGDRGIPKADFEFHIRKAERWLDNATTGKLKFAFPTGEDAADAINDCLCELVSVAYTLEQIENAAVKSTTTTTNESGQTVSGVVSSVSSGTESISYSSSALTDSKYIRAAEDANALNQLIRDITTEHLMGQFDANGVSLLYAGVSYPRRRS